MHPIQFHTATSCGNHRGEAHGLHYITPSAWFIGPTHTSPRHYCWLWDFIQLKASGLIGVKNLICVESSRRFSLISACSFPYTKRASHTLITQNHVLCSAKGKQMGHRIISGAQTRRIQHKHKISCTFWFDCGVK